MANASKSDQKKMEYKRVSFDVNEIAPDAPQGEWTVTIPRGKCKVQPTKEDKYPMLIVPFRITKCSDDEDETLTRAIGTELSTMIVFFDDAKPKAARMSKIKIRQLCEAADVDLDLIPKELDDPDNDLEPLIRALEGKTFTAWTVLSTRKDTGEVTTEVRFQDPKGVLKRAGDNEDDEDYNDDDEEEDRRPRSRSTSKNVGGGKKKAPSRSNGKRR
jgi:hypothetical protein